MTKFELKILGCGSAVPSLRHFPSCQIVDFRDNLMMIDCGEGAQLQMRRYKMKYSRLNHIFISHLHGDHVLGLPGLLSTLALHERTGVVKVYTFKEGIDVLKPLVDFFCRERTYDLEWVEISHEGGIVLDTDSIRVEAFKLYHRVPAVGFIFREKDTNRHINPAQCEFRGVPKFYYARLRAGEDFVTEEGIVIPNSELTTDPTPARSYAYCSDTRFNPAVAEAVKDVDTIYHEATYLNADGAKAAERYHSTAAEAAEIAKMAGAKLLLMGHYSKRYTSLDRHNMEAREVFPNSVAVDEGTTVDLKKCTVINV